MNRRSLITLVAQTGSGFVSGVASTLVSQWIAKPRKSISVIEQPMPLKSWKTTIDGRLRDLKREFESFNGRHPTSIDNENHRNRYGYPLLASDIDRPPLQFIGFDEVPHYSITISRQIFKDTNASPVILCIMKRHLPSFSPEPSWSYDIGMIEWQMNDTAFLIAGWVCLDQMRQAMVDLQKTYH